MGAIHKKYRNIKSPICIICGKAIPKSKNKKGYLIGGKCWLKRKVHKGECNKKYNRKRNLGKKLSKEHKRKVGLASLDRKHTLEQRIKMSKKLSGKNHYNWKGGITEKNHKIRRSLEYRLWREAVFKRDNYTCVLCGSTKGGTFQADHIKPFSKFPELRFSINNGRTVCIDCHKKTESWGNHKRKDIFTVTGASGFLGRNLIRFLKSKGHYVRAVTSPRLRETIIEADESFVSDGRDLEQLKLALTNTTYLFSMMANMGGVGYFNAQNYYPILNNFQIDLNVLKACEDLGIKRLFYPSSACIYPVDVMNQGADLREGLVEINHANPDQMYGWEKLTITKLMANSPVDCRVGILHTIYGPKQSYEGVKAKFPPQMAYKAVLAQKTGKLEVWGDGSQTRTFLYINDALEKIYEVMMKRTYYGPVNIGSDREVSVDEVVGVCCDILKIKPKIRHNLKKPTGPVRRRCSNIKFNKHYKYRDKTSLKKGFRNLIKYIQKCQNSKLR